MGDDANKIPKIPGTLFRSLMQIAPQRELMVVMYMPILGPDYDYTATAAAAGESSANASNPHTPGTRPSTQASAAAVDLRKKVRPAMCGPHMPLHVCFFSNACPGRPFTLILTPEQQIERVKTTLINTKEGDRRKAVARALCKLSSLGKVAGRVYCSCM
jgi:hypothetical protein